MRSNPQTCSSPQPHGASPTPCRRAQRDQTELHISKGAQGIIFREAEMMTLRQNALLKGERSARSEDKGWYGERLTLGEKVRGPAPRRGSSGRRFLKP